MRGETGEGPGEGAPGVPCRWREEPVMFNVAPGVDCVRAYVRACVKKLLSAVISLRIHGWEAL